MIEVGPGYGALTEYIIAERPKTLDLVELDPDMIDILDERIENEWYGRTLDTLWADTTPITRHYKLHSVSNTWDEDGTSMSLSIHHQDVLSFTPEYQEYSVIANIPYYITSPILFHFLYDLPTPPQEMTIMMQKEVGEKILAWRGKKIHHSYLSLAMELACEDIELIRYVGRESFDPPPKVDSIVLAFRIKKERDIKKEQNLLNLWKVAFTHPRKTLLSNLKGSVYTREWLMEILTTLGYDEKVRAEAIQLEDWEKLL